VWLTTIAMAANVLYVFPLMIVFFLAQKQILKGVIMSGLKG
jgi:ABC-type glycerol-3-phosphate transport system permease component